MSPAPISVYNTLSRAIEPLSTKVPGEVGLYVCGMTVYDYCHIGHARAMLAFDVVVRHLRHRGYAVRFVRNHTDVDDKIILRAREQGIAPLDLSAKFIAALEEDLLGVGLRPPDITPKVSDHIGDIVALISALVEKGHAYQATPQDGRAGDVNFSVASDPEYGKLSGKKLDDLRAGERVAVDGAKRHPADFALWKAWNGEPTEPHWPSPWGEGRPGWHIECSAMARHYLGDSFDLHGGGIDLVFPHHENEIAQSECGTGHPYATHWMHNGHLTIQDPGGEDIKMSKSLGNIMRIRDILAEVPGEALRCMFVESHYRSPLPYSSDRLTSSLVALDRLYCAKDVAFSATGEAEPKAMGEPGLDAFDIGRAFPERFYAAMDNDFNTAEAMGLVFDLVRAVNRLGNDRGARSKAGKILAPARAAFAIIADVIGVGAMEPQAFFDEMKVKRLRAMGRSVDEVEARIAARSAARATKDWAAADRLRAELDADNIVVMDGAAGSTWRMRVGD